MPLDQAAAYLVQQMNGKDRIPTLSKWVDSLARGKPFFRVLGTFAKIAI
jgi:hypothetical protein